MISVIIPVYNASLFLRQCLDSILQQTYHDWQAIIVNDGSTDNSAEIIKEYCNKDSRFIAVNKQNEGVSAARNMAIDRCTGQYILFLDSDDYLLSDCCLEKLANIAERNIDFIKFEYKAFDENNNFLFENSNKYLRNKYIEKVVSPSEYCRKVARGEFFLCMNLFNADIIKSNNIRFNTNCRFKEDTLFILQYLNCSSTATYTSEEYYAYRKHSLAATSAINANRYTKDLSIVFDEVSKLSTFTHNTDYAEYLEELSSEILLSIPVESSYFKERIDKCLKFKYKSIKFKIFYCSNYNIRLVMIFESILHLWNFVIKKIAAFV